MISNLNKSSAVDPTQSQSDPQAVKSRKKTEDGSQDDVAESNESFDKKLLQAGAIPSTQPATVNLSKEALGLGVHAQAQVKDQASGPKPVVAVNRAMESASFSPLTAKASAGVNAGSSIAGLKPWNQDWVLEGLNQPTPENADNAYIRPLIGGKSAMDEMAELASAEKALTALKAEAKNGNPGATQVLTDLRTRGEEGQLKAALNGLQNGDQGALTDVNARLASQLSQQLGSGGVSQQVSSQDLAQAMAQLNGKAVSRGPDLLQNPALNKLGGKGGAQDLSGGEFLNTLTLVKPGQQALNGDTVEAIGTRPAIQVSQFEGLGGRKKSSGFPEESISNRMLSAEMAGKSGQGFAVPMTAVIGHVVPGAMAQDQLSHEAVLNVSTGIKGLGQGNGEMKIHLKPDNLGDLHLKVTTRGQDVGIQILASDENAKKVIQDSMSTLKDGLASQNLNLGKVELAVARSFGADNQPSHDHSGNSSNSQSQQNSQNQFSSHFGTGQNAGQQNQGNRWTGADGTGDEAGIAAPLRSAQSASARLAMASGGGSSRNMSSVNDGRLDVLA
jgi:flagellar hook-length control protein FliK